MERGLKSGIITVLIANIINVFFGLATNFLLPKYLSVESYAGIKTFQLYVSYVGLLHLGYVDGMYLKYGGRDLTYKLTEDFSVNFSTMHIFQLAFSFILAIVAFASGDLILGLFIVSAFPQNLNNYFKYLYQATGEFKLYGRAMNLSSFSIFAVNTILLVFKQDVDSVYIISYVIVYYLIWIILEVNFRRKHYIPKTKLFDLKELSEIVRSGFLLTLGNIASMLLTSMDRWFVKFLMDTVAFAHYSFAVSVENFLNLAITPVTTTLYNYFCREQDNVKHKKILQYVLVFATVLPAAAFPVKFILEVYLDKYIESSMVIFILFSAQMFYVIIRSIYVNLYKVQKLQQRYFAKLSIIIVSGFLFNIICYQLSNMKESFAIGTLLAAILWYLITIPDFPKLQLGFKENIYLFSELALFLFVGIEFRAVWGLIIYCILTFILLLILMKGTMKNILAVVLTYVSRRDRLV